MAVTKDSLKAHMKLLCRPYKAMLEEYDKKVKEKQAPTNDDKKRREHGIERLAELAIFNFLVGNYEDAAKYSSGEMRRSLLVLAPSTINLRTKFVEHYRSALLTLKDTIVRMINDGNWDDEKAEELIKELKKKRQTYEDLRIDLMLPLVLEFADAAKTVKKEGKGLLELIMQLRI